MMINKEIAAKLMTLAAATDQPITEMLEVVELNDDAEVKARFKKAIKGLFGEVFRQIICRSRDYFLT